MEQKILQKTLAAQLKDSQKAKLVLKSLEQPDLPITGYTPKEFNNIKRVFNRYAYRAFLPQELAFAVAALHAAAGGRRLNAIQAGANDGIDPVHKLFHQYFDRLVLVEPQLSLIDRLRANYAGFTGQLAIENMAVGPAGGEVVLHIPDAHLEALYLRIVGRSVSFVVGPDRALTLKIMRDRCGLTAEEAERHLIATAIPCMGIAELARRHGYAELDFLQVDCEGYDWQVISTLGDYRPKIINFESKLLSREDWDAWVNFAAANDYGYVVCDTDTLAIHHARFG